MTAEHRATTRPRMRVVFLVAVLSLSLVPPALASALPPLSHRGRWLTDPQGRVMIVHGLQEWAPNGKLPGALPFGHQAPATLGYGRDDARFLAAYGFNAMRLSLSYWEASPGRYDNAYLAGFAVFARQLARVGVYSELDLQQAIYGPYFRGGEGFPAWMTLTDGIRSLPDAGYPNSYFANPAENRVWENFWANRPGSDGVGLQDHLARGWQHLAQRFAPIGGILAYDLLNEPWPGSMWQPCISPTGCPPGGFDDTRLTPFTKRVINAIRRADPARLVVYEPNLLFDFGADTRMRPPGDGNAVFGFHSYCLGGAVPGGSETSACGLSEHRVLQNAIAYGHRTGDALLLGEWGGTSGPLDTARLLALSDQYLLPWMNWYFGAVVRDPRLAPTGVNVDAARLRLLVRPYPQAIAGTPTGWSFDQATGIFRMTYSALRAGGGAFAPGTPTQIEIPALRYPTGYHVRATGARVISAPDADPLLLGRSPGASTVSLSVTPAAHHPPPAGDPLPQDCPGEPSRPLRVPRGSGPVLSATLYIDGQRVARRRGRNLQRIRLPGGLANGTTIRIVASPRRGARLAASWSIQGCRPIPRRTRR